MDGLSVAASVAGITALAAQLAESITKLCKFLSAIKHASEDIEDIIDDLEVLTCVIAEIQRCEELFGPQHATAKAIMRCRRQVQALESMVKTLNEELEKDSKWRRNHAALKAVMKGDKVKAMREKIGEAKDTLSLALQASSSRAQHTQLFAVMRIEGQMGQLGGQASQIQALVATSSGIGDQSYSSTQLNAISTSPSSVVATSNSISTTTSAARSRGYRARPILYQERVCWGDSESWTRSALGKLKYRRGSRNPKDEFSESDDNVVEIYFEPSWWLQRLGVSTLFQAQMDRSSRSGWNVSLRTPHLIPEELEFELWHLFEDGDLDSLRDMLSIGKVTIHSVTDYGHTLLHMAAEYAQPHICRFLIMAGADAKAKNTYGWEAIVHATFPQARSEIHLETMRILADAGEDFLDVEYSIALVALDYLRANKLEEPRRLDEDPLCWFTEKVLFPLQFCDDSLKVWWWSIAMAQTSDDQYTNDFLRFAFKNSMMVEKRIALIERVQRAAVNEETATLWLDEMDTLNFVVDYERCLYSKAFSTSRKGTMSSELMKSPQYFYRLRDFLQLCRVAVEDFVRGEAPLLQEIWNDKLEPKTEEKLLNLFDWDFGELILKDVDGEQRKCPSCMSSSYNWIQYEGNALWDLSVKQIWSGKSPDDPFEGEEKKLAEKWRGYYERCRVEGICALCQKREEEAMAIAENGGDNLEPSPLLLDL